MTDYTMNRSDSKEELPHLTLQFVGLQLLIVF